MNRLIVGVKKEVDIPEMGNFLLIDDNAEACNARIFDPNIHSFNPLRGMDYRRARDFAATVYGTEGKDTLTVRNGKRALTRLLLSNASRLDRIRPVSKDPAVVEAMTTVEDLLLSPVLRRVLCNPTNFSFKGRVVARLNRAELGDFDAFILGSLLIGQYQGQVIVPDFGFYGREMHTALVREGRLIAGVNFLSELPEKLRQNVLMIKDKAGSGVLYDDAVVLATYAGLYPDASREDNPYNEFIERVMG